ncbi:MAG: DUF1127 domain-containing protein [Cognatishimia sp.]|uniref:DUF1127 domain-containing protein n=1 Tax=Cognatishimia sp. TaxID=2211648 RepID=UPI003B8E6353
MTFLSTFGRFAGVSLEKGISLADLFELRRQRKTLASLTDRELRDIGLTPDDVTQEITRSVFDVPCHWRSQARR